MENGGGNHPQPTIYDVARHAGVSIASVSRVLNGRRNPLPDTRERVMQAVAELGFIPDGAARALSARLKEIVGVVYRRVARVEGSDLAFTEEDESLQFADVINRGIEVAAQDSGFNLLISSVDANDHDAGSRILALARKCDGLILHDQVLEPGQLGRVSRHARVVTLAGVPTRTTANVRGDNAGGMRELVRHLAGCHGYRSLAYLAGFADSPDNVTRRDAAEQAAAESGISIITGPQWQGDYYAASGAKVIDRLIASRADLPRAIICANDQTALGVVYALARHGVDVPGEVAVTGFDDIPVARRVRPQLTTVRQPIQELGATAFETLHAMITGRTSPPDIVLPTRLICRESCGCPSQPDAGGLGPAVRGAR